MLLSIKVALNESLLVMKRTKAAGTKIQLARSRGFVRLVGLKMSLWLEVGLHALCQASVHPSDSLLQKMKSDMLQDR